MSIVETCVVYDSDTVDESKTSLQIQAKYRIRTDADHSSNYVLQNADLPEMNEVHDENTGLFVDSRRIKRVSQRVFECNVTWKPLALDGETDEPEVHPTSREPVITWTFEPVQKEMTEDVNGDLIDSVPNEEPILATKTIYRPTCNITKNYASFNAGVALDYIGKVNETSFMSAAPYTALVSRLGARNMNEVFEGETVSFWEVSFSVSFAASNENKNGNFKLEILNQAYKYKDGSGNWIQSEDGRVKYIESDGTLGEHYLTFYPYEEAELNDLL